MWRDPHRKGFTLVEMMVAMVVLGIMGITVANILRENHQVQSVQNTGVMATQNVRAGLDMLARELRNAGYDPMNQTNAGLTTMLETDIAWTADLNEDGDVEDFGPNGDEAVRYFFDSDAGTLVRDVNGVQSVVSDGLTSVSFRYLDPDMTAAASDDRIAYIQIDMTYATPDGVMEGGVDTSVALLNRVYTVKNKRSTVCHSGNTQVVNTNSLNSHLKHGDTIGPCL